MVSVALPTVGKSELVIKPESLVKSDVAAGTETVTAPVLPLTLVTGAV